MRITTETVDDGLVAHFETMAVCRCPGLEQGLADFVDAP